MRQGLRSLLKQITALLCAFAIVGLSTDQISAQQLTAQIRGTVTDASGAAIPEASVTATNTQTQVKTVIPSKADGSYEFLQLPVGTYNVSVVRPGFRAFTSTNIKLELDQIFRLPVSMEVGQVSESVQVEANSVQVETSTTQLSTVIQSQTIQDLPLNGRNWVQLQQLAPGVVSTSDRFSSNYATNGSQSQQNAFLINGADSNDIPLNTPLIIPSPDAISEFNLIDSTANPEYGRNSGAILNAIIKSGTNEFHGDAFEFYRDTFLDGRNLFQVTKPVYHQNQFGGTLGGPVWKDHTFFFVSYQGARYRQPEAGGQVNVFTQAQRNGTFSDLTNSNNLSPFALVGSNGQTYAAGTPYKSIFAGGTIPAADFNPIAQELLTSVPLPNSPGNIYSFNPIIVGQNDQGIARIDHTFNQKDAVWGTVFFQDVPSHETLPFTGSTLPGFGDQSKSAAKTYTADWTHTFGPTTVNEARLSYVRLNLQTVEPQQSVLPSTLGFNITPQNSAAAGIPYVSVTGYFALGFSTNGPQPRIDETYEAADNFSKVIGNHTLKLGFDGKRYGVANPFSGNNNGNYSFGGAGKYSTGDAAADYLLGVPDSYRQGSGSVIVARTYEYYGYLQDNWKASQNLTLNIGVGYQVDTPLHNLHFGGEAFNCFRPGQQSTVFPTAPSGLLFPGDKSCTSSGYSTQFGNIAPRFGFAYSPGSSADKKFVVRGGFGLYYNRTEEELTLQNLGAVPFSLTSGGIADVGGYPTFANPFQDIATGATIANKFPFTPATPGSNVNFTPYEPLGINTVNPDFRDPTAMNFNLNVQREFPGSMLLQMGYVGALGRHLEIDYEGNPISPAGQAACAVTPACVSNRSTQHVSYPSHALYEPGNVFASVGTQATAGNSEYNSFQATLTKRPTHGLGFLAAYTYSHSIDDGSGFENTGLSSTSRGTNPFNFASNRGDSSYDARQRLVISYDYEVPHVSRFWNNAIVRTALDGWHVSGITTLQSGFPVLITDSGSYRSLTCDSRSYYACWDAPNYLTSPATYNARNSTLVNTAKTPTNTAALNYYYFNPNAFGLEAIGTLGNEGRDNFRGPGINNTDLDLAKRIYLDKEDHRSIELRLEGYNVFNHTQFSTTGVTGSINNTNFGRILSAASARTIQLGAKFYF